MKPRCFVNFGGCLWKDGEELIVLTELYVGDEVEGKMPHVFDAGLLETLDDVLAGFGFAALTVVTQPDCPPFDHHCGEGTGPIVFTGAVVRVAALILAAVGFIVRRLAVRR